MWTFDILPDYGQRSHAVRRARGAWNTPTIVRHTASSQIMGQRPKFIDVWVELATAVIGVREEHHVRIMRHGAVSFVNCTHGSIGQQRMMALLGLGEDTQCPACMGLLYALAEGYSYFYGGAGGAFHQDYRRMMDGTVVRNGHGRISGHRGLLRKRGAFLPRHGGIVPMTMDEARTNRQTRNMQRNDHAAWQPGRPGLRQYGMSTQSMLLKTIAHCSMLSEFKTHRIIPGITDGLHAEAWTTGKGWGDKPKHLKAMVPTAWRYLFMRGLAKIDGHLVGAIAGMRDGALEAWCLKVNTPYPSTDWHLATFDRINADDATAPQWRFNDWRKGYSWRRVMDGKTQTHRDMKARMLRADGTLRVMPDGFSLHYTIVGGI
jgi:hypothetical protein